ncbi:MAG TPA: DUF401 family protein [Candidatus Limnocylindrales bacterium]|nr:DUF401 family protein [Candidatus Limnocylindrales bacterium]
MPWYIGLSCSILVILGGLHKKVNIGLIMIAGALLLGALQGLPLPEFFATARDSLLDRTTLVLITSVVLLGILGHILEATGSLSEMFQSIEAMVDDLRLVTAALPMFVGMLTVPGGAIFSAPMCAVLGNRLNMPAHRQASANIWFRHILYLMLPLFPAMILASQLSGVSVNRFMLHNIHLTVIGTVGAYFYLFRGLPKNVTKSGLNLNWDMVKFFLRSVAPLLLILTLVVLFNVLFPVTLVAAILLALLNYLPRYKPLEVFWHRMKTMLLPGLSPRVAIIVAGIMFYKEMLEVTGAIYGFTGFLMTLGVPIIFLIAVVPFFVGALIGDNTASVGILFPLFMPLLPVGGSTYSAYLAFLFVSSSVGHILSPAHPCFSLTKEYFKVEFKGILKDMLPLLALVMTVALITTLFFGYY